MFRFRLVLFHSSVSTVKRHSEKSVRKQIFDHNMCCLHKKFLKVFFTLAFAFMRTKNNQKYWLKTFEHIQENVCLQFLPWNDKYRKAARCLVHYKPCSLKTVKREVKKSWLETQSWNTFCNLSKLRYGLNGLITVQLWHYRL